MMNDWKEWGILTSMLIAAVMWVQVPQWADDWAICAVAVSYTHLTLPTSDLV